MEDIDGGTAVVILGYQKLAWPSSRVFATEVHPKENRDHI
jgi:hypothetical protein